MDFESDFFLTYHNKQHTALDYVTRCYRLHLFLNTLIWLTLALRSRLLGLWVFTPNGDFLG